MKSKSPVGATPCVARIFQIILYIPIQIAFIPIAIVGLIVAIYKEMVVAKRLGVSFTSIKALQYRWFMHYFGTRRDPFAVEFVRSLPCESHFGLWATMGALIVSNRLFGFSAGFGKLDPPGEERSASTAARRVLAFDEILKKHVDEVEQVVIPGSGFDLIALHFTKGKGVKVFELDQVDTLNVKVEALKRAGIDHDWITYVPVDYAKESWVEKLGQAGFDQSKKTLFLWQSVSLFLEEEVVRESLRQMADLCVEGSIVAQDMYWSAFTSGVHSKTAKRAGNIVAKQGEPWKFGLDFSNDPEAAVEAFLKECGLTPITFTLFGEKLKTEPFYCIVESVKAD